MSTARRLLSILEDFGISVTPINTWESAIEGYAGEVKLRRGRSAQLYTVLPPIAVPRDSDVLDQIREASRQSVDQRFLMTGEKLNARTMSAYRSGGIDYLDLAGNAFIRFGDVYVDVQGRSLDSRRAVNESRHAPVNLFSARRSQVTFALLVWPELFDLPIRITSEAAGVSIGLAFQTSQLLRESGYIVGDASPRLVRRSDLIDKWTDAYTNGPRRKLVLGRYRGDKPDVRSIDPAGSFLISGECAVPSLLRPTTLTLYASELDPRLISAHRWRRDGQPNIEILKKFWKDPRQILHEQRDLDHDSVERRVPLLLVYADLMASGDGRQREAAVSFRNEHHELVDG